MDEQIRRLLLDCGFRSARWPNRRQRWGLVGEVDGGLRMTVRCVDVADGVALAVPTAATRDWLRDVLRQHGYGQAPIAIIEHSDTPWLALTLGAAATLLFGWFVASLSPNPFSR